MRAHELTEKISIKGQRDLILKRLESKVGIWHEMASEDDGQLKWIMLEDLNEMFQGMDIAFDFDYFDGSTISTGETRMDGAIKIFFDPQALTDGPINFLESPDLFIRAIAKSITHELLHRNQLLASNVGLQAGDADGQRDAYMSLPHEIQAYAKDAADELVALYGSKERVIQTIRRNGWRDISFDSDTLRAYRDTFREDPDDPSGKVWKTFLKYFYFYLGEY